ncbi:MAG TPA: metallophosphoesterase, partial [Armatimonadota bacterium]|nr:metallophosphoesterase [Armatimonadota bacterium]
MRMELWLLAGAITMVGCVNGRAQDAPDDRVLNFVVIPDAHTRTGSLVYLPQIVERINALTIQPDFVMSLGDNVSGGEDHEVQADAERYEAAVGELKAPHYYVIGNHECIPIEVYKLLTWEGLLSAWDMQERWYSFDVHGFHICVLDGWISLAAAAFADDFGREQEWLTQDLAQTDRPTVVFIHQALGFQQEDCQQWIDSDNRKFWPAGNFFETIFERYADQIVGVFEGHKHKSLYKTQGGVTYHQMGASHAHDGQ